MRNFLSVFTALLLAGLAVGCHTPPKFPIEPNISFKQVEQYHFTEAGRPKDSLVIVTRFEDGDGDLGLTDADKDPPFNSGGEFFHNYFITMYIKRVGQTQFTTYQFPNINGLNGRFFPLAPDGRIGPLEGDLKYGFVIRPNRDFAVGDMVKFDVYIVDKQLHKSNKITTDEVTLFQ